jgi:hypothetical protein
MAEKDPKADKVAEGVTTRDDANDLGVPMLAGDPSEPTGPEDALGEGPKRGDYTDRIGPSNYHPHTASVVDGKTQLEAQRPRAAEVGEVAGRKGGVDSAED